MGLASVAVTACKHDRLDAAIQLWQSNLRKGQGTAQHNNLSIRSAKCKRIWRYLPSRVDLQLRCSLAVASAGQLGGVHQQCVFADNTEAGRPFPAGPASSPVEQPALGARPALSPSTPLSSGTPGAETPGRAHSASSALSRPWGRPAHQDLRLKPFRGWPVTLQVPQPQQQLNSASHGAQVQMWPRHHTAAHGS